MKPELYIPVDLPNDEELERLTRYVGGYMSPEEVELFDRQLEEDEEFFYRMAPMLDAWYAPDPLPVEVEVLRQMDRQAAEQRRVAPVRRVKAPRWRRPFAMAATLSLAAEVLFVIAQVGSRATPELARMVAHAPSSGDSLRPGSKQPPRTQAPAVAVTAKRPRATKRVAPPVKETQVAVAPVDVDSALALPALPDAAFTPSRLIAFGDTLHVREWQFVAELLNLGSDYNLLTLPASGAATGDNAMPSLDKRSWLRRIWDWITSR